MTGKGGDAPGLAVALGALGVPVDVEARGALAVIRPRPDGLVRLADEHVRAAALGRAREHGFTHLAVELPVPSAADATVLRH